MVLLPPGTAAMAVAGTRAPALPARLHGADLLIEATGGAHGAFEASGGRRLRPRLARALALAALAPGLRVVDVGSGRGEAAAHALRRGAVVTVVDYSPSGIRLARRTVRRVAAARGDQALPALADATRLPVADASAERVLLLDVVEHLQPWQLRLALMEIRRILQPGGYVVIHTLPNRWALTWAYPFLRVAAPGLPADPRSAYERVVHVNEQDPRSLARSLAAAGLAARVWVEDWTTRQAAWSQGLTYSDVQRRVAYPILARPAVRRVLRLAMGSPARWLVANDLFALAWRPDGPAPPLAGRFRPLR